MWERFKSQPTARGEGAAPAPSAVCLARQELPALAELLRGVSSSLPRPGMGPAGTARAEHRQDKRTARRGPDLEMRKLQIPDIFNSTFWHLKIQHFQIQTADIPNPDSSDLEFRKFKSKVQRFPNFESQKFQISEMSNSRCGHFKICHFQIQDSNIP